MVIAVVALGMTVGALPHIAAGRPAGLTGMCARLIAVAFVAFTFRPFVGPVLGQSLGLAFGVMALLVTLGWLLETVITARDQGRGRAGQVLGRDRDEMRVQWRLGLAVGVSVIITVFGATVMGLLELAVFVGPLFVIQLAFRRYAGIRATYLQTVRSLAQVTEVAGYVEAGHSRRVSQARRRRRPGARHVRARPAEPRVRRAHARHRPALAGRSDPGRRHRLVSTADQDGSPSSART